MVVPKIKTILYATDLSPSARNAFAYAATLANALDAKVIILHCIEEPPSGTGSAISQFLGEDKWAEVKKSNQDKVVEMLRERLTNFCSEAQDDLPECPFITQEIMVKMGHPVETILRTADECDCDLVVMGSHGVGGIMGAMLGSTSRQVSRRCTRPMMIVRLSE
jgi:nucleotide-binding universal stress UspA family protein